MRYDVEIPTCREGIFTPAQFAGPSDILATVVEAERLGYETVWATDFVTPCPSSGITEEVKPDWYEPLIALSFAAAATDRIRLGTGVLMMPYRDTVSLAKQAATLDRFSNGRFVLGMGLGAFKDEFQMVQPRNRKMHRGRYLDEQIESLLALFDPEQAAVSFDGEFVAFDGLRLYPKPCQSPLPMYLPCRNETMIERAARWRLGAMFHATDAAKQLPLIDEALSRHGGERRDIDIIGEAELCIASTHEAAVAAYAQSAMGRYRTRTAPGKARVDLDAIVSRNWIGTVEEVAEKVAAARDAGLDHVNALHIAGDDMQVRLEQMSMFAEDVIAKL